MQPAGLGAAQYGVLMTLKYHPGASVSDLAATLDMDRSTLTRNLQPLIRDDLVAVTAGPDKRSRSVRITDKGVQRLALAKELWVKAQATVSESLGAAETKALNDLLGRAIAKLP